MGGPSVDTVLATPSCAPGELLSGEVRIKAADYDVEIQRVTLALVTVVEVEGGDHEHSGGMEFHRVDVSGPFTLAKGQDRTIPFSLDVPWETPLTEVHGHHLHGMALGVRTELAVAKAVDKGDLDPLGIVPLPSQRRVLDAFGELGFAFKNADVEYGHIAGVPQQLPFYQEIEFYPPPTHHGRINEVELTFVANPHGLAVILEADKRGGLFTSGGDAFGRFQVSHEEALHLDWAAEISAWLDAVAERHASAPHPGHAMHGGHHGPGWGTAAAAGAAGMAAGVVGGMVAGELAEEAVEEFFEGDED